MSETRSRTRADYGYFLDVATRWRDNDVYGHVNNVIYYEMIDSVVNRYLVEVGGLDYQAGAAVGIVPESRCIYRKPVRFPEILAGGLAVKRLGRTSVVYDVGLFKQGDDEAAAEGHFVHVFVDRREQSRPVPIPDPIRTALARLVRTEGGGE